ncbi:unnamed protein product [Penicillium glandicola]
MSENSGVQFMGARTKRTHRDMATENDGSDDAAWEEHFHPPRPDYARSESTRLPPRRHRDGFDYRRPAMLSGNHVVIDLTDDPDSPPQTNVTPLPSLLQHTPPPYRPMLRFPGDLINHTPHVVNNPDAETNGTQVPGQQWYPNALSPSHTAPKRIKSWAIEKTVEPKVAFS